MKKELLAGTAIVGASLLMAGTAYADWPKDPKVWVSGSFDFQIGMSDQDLEGFSGAAGAITSGNDRGFGFITNSEVRIRAKGKTDSGMKWSAKMELEVDANVGTANQVKSVKLKTITTSGTHVVTITLANFDESVIDELQITFSGSWGKLVLGNEDGAEDLLHVSSEHAVDAGSGGVEGDWADWSQTESTSSRFINDPTMQKDSSDATKITYFTPRVNGFMLGVSYAPDGGAAGQNLTTDDGGDTENFWGFGGSYKQKFGDFSLSVGAVGAIADDESSDKEDTRAWALGAMVGWGHSRLPACTRTTATARRASLTAIRRASTSASAISRAPFFSACPGCTPRSALRRAPITSWTSSPWAPPTSWVRASWFTPRASGWTPKTRPMRTRTTNRSA